MFIVQYELDCVDNFRVPHRLRDKTFAHTEAEPAFHSLRKVGDKDERPFRGIWLS